MKRDPSHTDWQRLGAAVRARRNLLGLAQGKGGPSAATWRKVEGAQEYPYAERTVSAICRTLGWPSDAFDRLLAGDDPDTLVEAAGPNEEDENLSDVIRDLAEQVRLLRQELRDRDSARDAP